MARYNPNGSTDTSFGFKGEAIVHFGIYGSYAYSMALQADGKIVLAGQTYDGTNSDIGLARLNTNGSLDNSFGTAGEVVTPITSPLAPSDARLRNMNMAMDPNSGKFVVVANISGGEVLRYNTNGTLDTGFGGSGTGSVILGNESRPAVVVQPDDRIVVAGNNRGGVVLDRLNADGTLDQSFGSGGTVLSFPPANGGAFVTAVALQANGQIVVGGSEAPPIGNGWGLMAARWNTDGSVDTTFGTAGFAMTASGTGRGQAVAFEPDGRIVVVGLFDFVVARFLATGPQIGSFTASPNPVTAGSDLTLTTSNITDANPGARITQVAFYQDSNGDGVLEPGTDTLLGYGTQTSPGTWIFTFSTTGLASEAYTFFAVAADNDGVLGDALAATEQVI